MDKPAADATVVDGLFAIARALETVAKAIQEVGDEVTEAYVAAHVLVAKLDALTDVMLMDKKE
jgi:hypothetical protein